MTLRYAYLLLDLLDAMSYDSKVEIDDAALAIFGEDTNTVVTAEEMNLAADMHIWVSDWISENGDPSMGDDERWSIG